MWRYTIRSLWARRWSVQTSVLASFLIASAVVVAGAGLEGLKNTIVRSGSPDNALVVTRDAQIEEDSTIPFDQQGKVKVLPGIAGAAGALDLSFETLLVMKVRALGTMEPTQIKLRGVDPGATEVHRDVKLIEGRWPKVDEPGLVAGRGLQGRVANVSMGATLPVGHTRWPIIGVFDGGITPFNAEIWADRTALATAYRTAASNVASFRLDRRDALPEIARIVSGDKTLRAEALSEPEFRRRSLGQATALVGTLTFALVLLGVGASIACSNTMHAGFMTRIREMSTLVAIGYAPWMLALMLLAESLFLTSVGALGAMVVAYAIDHREVSLVITGQTPLVIRLIASSGVLLLAWACAAGVAMLSASFAVVKVLRLDVLDGLRRG